MHEATATKKKLVLTLPPHHVSPHLGGVDVRHGIINNGDRRSAVVHRAPMVWQVWGQRDMQCYHTLERKEKYI
jgi:hypothetical protein